MQSKRFFLLFLLVLILGPVNSSDSLDSLQPKTAKDLFVGAQRLTKYIPLIAGKKVAIVANQTSMVGSKHLVDTLLDLGIDIQKVFAPEHGFRGLADAGEHIKDALDKKTGLPIVSLYGKNKKPKASDLSNVDVILFDIQDVGVRFYTYISSLHYIMQACADLDKTLIVLDRPNPNGFFVDGPVLRKEYSSFVGVHEVPLVHGMTIGEFSKMINGEGWLEKNVQCNLKIITCEGYTHNDLYQLPIKPSPNLPNMASVYLYPSLGLFEGTNISVGRGTETPFQIIGSPYLKQSNFSFTPVSVEGAKYPKHKGVLCKGFDLNEFGSDVLPSKKGLYLGWILGTYKNSSKQDNFFTSNGFFELLSGTDVLRKQIIEGKSEKEIKATWQEDIQVFKEKREKYLLYPDFE